MRPIERFSVDGSGSSGHGRSKNGVASLAYDPAIHPFSTRWMRGSDPRMTKIDSMVIAANAH
jgi:hypothetical protein